MLLIICLCLEELPAVVEQDANGVERGQGDLFGLDMAQLWQLKITTVII